jgi:GT2 family glycosyltransferase
MEKIYILLPVHNRRAITQRFMGSLIRQQYQNYHLVLIDDGSNDGTEEMVRSYLPEVTVIRGEGNWWWGGSLHQGYLWLEKQSLGEGDVVLIINDDTEFESEYLTIAIESIRKNPNSLLISRCFDRRTRSLIDSGPCYMDLRSLKFKTIEHGEGVNCATTRGLFLKGADFLALGGFYPSLLPHYLSDIEFTLRACKKGFKIVSDSRLALFLDEEATGYHDYSYDTVSVWLLLKRFFSKKSSQNPICWTAFALIACPWRSKLTNVMRIWAYSVYILQKQILSQYRRTSQKRV